MFRVLIADDEPNMRFFLSQALKKEGFAVLEAENGEKALEILRTEQPELALLDIKMPKMTGMQVLETMQNWPLRPITLVISAFGNREQAWEAIQKGAYDYFTKPLDLAEIRVVLHRAVEKLKLEKRIRTLESQEEEQPFDSIVTVNEEMLRMIELLQQVVKTDVNILVTGESGTGKEVIAAAIHKASHRAHFPFVKINCVAIPEALLESELFGYEKGAFTGAARQKKGKIEMASQGTIFLDEIGDMNSFLQAKLLRFLQEKEIERVGGIEPIPVDVRVIAATNRKLEQEIEANRFREDLYFRLNVVNVHLPPLRERREDIPLLADFFVQKYCRHYQKATKELAGSTLRLLEQLDWPGNVRQLENVIHRAVVLSAGHVIDPTSLPDTGLQLTAKKTNKIQPHESLHQYLERMQEVFEKEAILEALKRNDYNRSQTATELGISRQTLYNKLEKYAIVMPF